MDIFTMLKQNKKYIHDITQYNMIISLINFIKLYNCHFLGEEVQSMYQTCKPKWRALL